MKRAKRYEAEYQGRKVRVTVPEADPVGVGENSPLREAIREALSPEAVATLANAVRVQVNGGLKDRAVRRQLKWFAEQLVEMLGGEDAYRRACREAGL